MNKKVKPRIFHCNFFPKNHRGTDKMISVYWFLILFIVAGAVVYMASVFYGEPYDVRDVEANLLVNHIADCIAEGGEFNEKIIDDEGNFLLNNDNFFEVCNLNFDVEEFKGRKNNQYYVEVGEFGIEKGNVNLKDFCTRKEKNCVERSFYVSKEIKILVVVRKTEKNV